jgi:histidine ammonia-lyase
MHKIVQIDGEALTIEDVVEVAYERAKVSIPEPVKARVNRSRQVLEELLEKGETIYGVNTAALNSHRAENSSRRRKPPALSVEALHGVIDALDGKIHEARPHLGQAVTAKNLIELVLEAGLSEGAGKPWHARGKPHDAYSIKCKPQVLGPARDAVAYARRIVEIEMNSATDNPLVFPDEGVCLQAETSTGNPYPSYGHAWNSHNNGRQPFRKTHNPPVRRKSKRTAGLPNTAPCGKRLKQRAYDSPIHRRSP